MFGGLKKKKKKYASEEDDDVGGEKRLKEDADSERVYYDHEDNLASASQQSLLSLQEVEGEDSVSSPEKSRSPIATAATTTTTTSNTTKRKNNKPRESEHMSSKGFRKEKKKKWIEPTEDGKYLVLVGRRENSPVVNQLEDARNVVEWFREEGFIGVKKRDDNNKGYSSFMIVGGKLEWIDQMFQTAEDAARAHDEHVRANGLKYRKNFRVVKSRDQPDIHIFNRSADLRYMASNSKSRFVWNNLRLNKFLLIRLCQDPLCEPVEIWTTIEHLVNLTPLWSLGTLVPITVVVARRRTTTR